MPQVLIVEDAPDLLSSIAEVLRDAGYAVETAANGYQALERVARQRPDVIFLDVVMPRMDGWRFLEQVAERFPDCSPPVVLLSPPATPPAAPHRFHIRHVLARPLDLEQVTRIARECVSCPCPPTA